MKANSFASIFLFPLAAKITAKILHEPAEGAFDCRKELEPYENYVYKQTLSRNSSRQVQIKMQNCRG